jgi:uncharacterized membrane protein YedE/YeeE
MTFTPGAGLVGGLLIGAASAALLLANGRIAGISGILGNGLDAARNDRAWRIAFLLGLPLGATLATRATSDAMGFAISADPLTLVAAGLLVGVGTRLGHGCTSGHGVCGIARGSRRSLVATAIFMLCAAITVYTMRHILEAGA